MLLMVWCVVQFSFFFPFSRKIKYITISMYIYSHRYTLHTYLHREIVENSFGKFSNNLISKKKKISSKQNQHNNETSTS